MRSWHVFLFTVLVILSVLQPARAQKLPMPTDDLLRTPTEEGNWNIHFRAGLNGSQAYYREWAQGGVDRIAVVANSIFTGLYTEGAYQYAFRLDLRYGQTRLNRGDFRKSEDVIRLRNQFRRRFSDERFSLTANINFETQFDKGYDRSYENVRSRFMAPGTVTETVGLSYNPDDYLQSIVGVSLRQTYISDTSLSTLYGLPEGEWFRNEAGFTIIMNYDREIWKNVTYTGYLESFSNMQKSLLSTDVTFNNELVGRINNYLTTNFEFAIRYNDDITKALQIKQILSVGINYRFR